jgi:methyl-accepting chemotaxis protein
VATIRNKAGRSARSFSQRFLDQTELITSAADRISSVNERIKDGTVSQKNSLDELYSGTNELAASLRETYEHAESLASSSEELV